MSIPPSGEALISIWHCDKNTYSCDICGKPAGFQIYVQKEDRYVCMECVIAATDLSVWYRKPPYQYAETLIRS